MRVFRKPPADLEALTSGAAREDQESWSRLRAETLQHELRVSEATSYMVVQDLQHTLTELCRALHAAFGSPHLGNKADPIDELVYIILSRRTREGAYQAAFDALKERYPEWEQLAQAPSDEIERTIGFSGLSRRKARSLKQALGALVALSGSCTLEVTDSLSDEETRAFLCALPEVGPKSAACVMMCALDRPVFPVDAHVGRVLARLGTFETIGIHLERMDHKQKQAVLWDAVPPSLTYVLHVNLLVLGREVCKPRRPRCGACPISAHCRWARDTLVLPKDVDRSDG